MTAFLQSAWSFEPSVVVGCAALALARAVADGFRPRRGWVPFITGTAVLFAALTSPLDALADECSFSAHMLQHMILVLVVPPLWIAGLPAARVRAVLRHEAVSRVERVASSPFLACGVAVAVLGAWHVPRLYDAAVASEGLHVVEHLCLLAAFTVYWWPVLVPIAERRLAPGAAILHLAAGAVATSALGILVTFASPALFGAYTAPGAAPDVAAAWRAVGLDRGADLTLSGLLMWMAGTPVFLVVALAAIARWCREADREDLPMAGTND